MGKETNIMLDLKVENRNRIFNAIREEGSISGPELSYKLQLSRPTVTQNLNELKAPEQANRSGAFYMEMQNK